MGFKVGDKVIVRNDLIIGEKYGDDFFITGMKDFVGKIVTIKRVVESGLYKVEENYYNWTDEMLEPFEFDKAFLKSGHIVKRRNDSYAIVLDDITYSDVGYSQLKDYNDDLSNKFTKDLDIIAIYKPGYTDVFEILKGSHLTLIAKRPEEVKEMTLAEVCKELGYNVKIVKEV